VLTAGSVSVFADDSVKARALRQTGKQLLQVGAEQYKRGLYESAQATLLKAAKYREYLSVADSARLNTLLEQVVASLSQSPETVTTVTDVNYILPEESVERVTKDHPSAPSVGVDKPEQALPEIIELKQVQPQPQAPTVQSGGDIEAIYSNSVRLFNEGKYEEARYGFARVIASGRPAGTRLQEAQVYLRRIDEKLGIPAVAPVQQLPAEVSEDEYSQVMELPPIESAEVAGEVAEWIEPVEPVQIEPVEPVQIQPAEPGEMPQPQDKPEERKESYIEVIKQKQRIQISYTKAVVNDAIARAKELAGANEFARAKDEVARARSVLEKNKLLLGDELYGEYDSELDRLLEQITTSREKFEQERAERAQAEAQAAQERLRQQQAIDRQKRIEDLMMHAMEYQEQQRYEEALGQLETLLAIDPTNKEAARNKQMLEDIINLRRQVEVKREMGREEMNLFYDTQKSMIPHAELITYPRNWQDITAKRKTEPISGLSPVDAAVYRQMETVVDLSMLNPDMPFDEAIEIIRASVDPPLKLTVRWRDLEENAYIERDTAIGMQGISGIPLGKAIKEVLNSVSGGFVELDYAIEDGIITIATKQSLPGKLIPRVYDITELIGVPAQFRAELEAGMEDIESSASSAAREDFQVTAETKAQSIATIMQMIQETIAPSSWYINGGEGTISSHGNRLIVSQTPQIHEQIQKLLMEDLRESLGQQVSIETRFLFVTENFLEDIGLDSLIRIGSHGKWSEMIFEQGSYESTTPGTTGIPGSLADTVVAHPALNLVGGVTYGSVLDDLTVSFFLRATQAHRDAKVLTAPKVTVLSSESAYITVRKETSYVSDYDFEDITASGEGQPTRVIADPVTDTVVGGVVLNVTPTISSDKRYVLLQISTSYTKADLDDFTVYAETGEGFPIQLPIQEIAELQTRVSVPDGGTLLIGGQKLSAEINKESGVPGLSKIPFLGRLFSNRSKVKDQDILLILVKPTIILQDEAERDYFAPLR